LSTTSPHTDADGVLTIAAVGDVIVNREQPETMFESTGAVLRAADITFGNCETPYGEPAPRNPIARGALNSDPSNAAALATAAGFDVMSFANNHHLDHGYGPFEQTLEVLRGHGIATCGAGMDIEEARKPAIVECNGTKVAFLAYATVMFLGYEAEIGKPGAAPLRAHTHYVQVEDEQPGTPPDILTFTDPADLEAMKRDVRQAKEVADIVVFTCHWGLHYTRAKVAHYEREAARAAIDAGADIVLGHHAHILKGVDSYRGKLIFHSLGNFAMDLPVLTEGAVTSPRALETFRRYPNDFQYDPEYPRYPFTPDARKTLIVRMRVRNRRIDAVEILPCLIQPDNSPRLVDPGEPMFLEIVDYLSAIGAEENMTASVEANGSSVIVTASTD
jgi:poly-gamma-glutamate synthesis protein (capsule biosynthesis protein)